MFIQNSTVHSQKMQNSMRYLAFDQSDRGRNCSPENTVHEFNSTMFVIFDLWSHFHVAFANRILSEDEVDT